MMGRNGQKDITSQCRKAAPPWQKRGRPRRHSFGGRGLGCPAASVAVPRQGLLSRGTVLSEVPAPCQCRGSARRDRGAVTPGCPLLSGLVRALCLVQTLAGFCVGMLGTGRCCLHVNDDVLDFAEAVAPCGHLLEVERFAVTPGGQTRAVTGAASGTSPEGRPLRAQ